LVGVQGFLPAQKIASNTLVLVIANNHEFDFDKTWILEMFHQRRQKNLSDSLTQKLIRYEIEYLSIIVLRFCQKKHFCKEIKRYNGVSPPETLVLLLYSIYHWNDTFFLCGAKPYFSSQSTS